MDKVSAYIKANWEKTFHPAHELKGDIKIKHPYVSPCVNGVYVDLYYWDSYFINLGLLLDGYEEQARNNIDNIATFINALGFMPNANYLLDRSQPPFFTRMVYHYYKKTKDLSIIEDYISTILKEYDFWQSKRKNVLGLNSYGTHGSKEEILQNYEWHHARVGEYRDSEEEQIILGKDIMAVAESGLDFNMRFKTEESKIDAHKFSHLDLDCILFDMESKAGEMLSLLGREEEAKKFRDNAAKRKELMKRYYLTPEGIYLDYNFEDKCFSSILSAASLYPYTFGVSSDKEGALKTLARLELPYGLPACEKREDTFFYQWDYPLMWPAATTLAYMGLKEIGLHEEARRIAKKYVDVARNVFEETGRLWEKYDASNGKIGVSNEYETMPMIGWTAGAYRYFVEEESL